MLRLHLLQTMEHSTDDYYGGEYGDYDEYGSYLDYGNADDVVGDDVYDYYGVPVTGQENNVHERVGERVTSESSRRTYQRSYHHENRQTDGVGSSQRSQYYGEGSSSSTYVTNTHQ